MFCIYCKGAHTKENCPIVLRARISQRRKKLKISQDITSHATGPFIGHYGYPHINVGLLTPIEEVPNAWEYDAPHHWAANNFSVNQIMEFRTSLLNSRMNAHVKSLHKVVQVGQEVSMASKPADIEINLKDKPRLLLKLDSYAAPRGIQGTVNKVRLTSNPHVATKVENIISDIDLKAGEGIISLYKKGLDENFIMKNLSIGNLGVKKNRKLVPTRWSITATDEAIAKILKKEIQDHNEINYQVYFGGHLGNYFALLFFPDVFRYELFEMALKHPDNITHDYEGNFGRKQYANETAGGYYACKLPVLEKLSEVKKKGSVLAIRIITDEYHIPLGVWVVREATRKALKSKPVEFTDKKMMFEYVKDLMKKKFGIIIDGILRKSELISELNQQSKLTQWG